jgi:tRNA pseudouridine(38-40) synthase
MSSDTLTDPTSQAGVVSTIASTASAAASLPVESGSIVDEASTVAHPLEKSQRERKKLKAAIIFGYVGAAYFGLQHTHDPSRPSVEAKVFDALTAAGCISEANTEGTFLKKVDWQRASRTDRGVSALHNVLSAKLELPRAPAAPATLTNAFDQYAAVVAAVNAALPADIRLYSLLPATASFNSYLSCTGRRYEYLLPTFCLAPPSELMATLGFPGTTRGTDATERWASAGGEGVQVKQLPSADLLTVFQCLSQQCADAKVAFAARHNTGTTVAADEEEYVEEGAGDDAPEAAEAGSGNGKRRPAAAGAGRRRGRDDEVAGAAAGAGAASPNKALSYYSMPFRSRKSRDDPTVELIGLDAPTTEAVARLRAACLRHRLSPTALAQARTFFRMMEGTNTFHNFTPHTNATGTTTGGCAGPDDPAATRFIKRISVSEPFIVRTDAGAEVEVVQITLDGQSFMLNQIRKMVGTVVDIISRGSDGGYLRSLMVKGSRPTVSPTPANADATTPSWHLWHSHDAPIPLVTPTPMAPANGLFLSTLYFDRYNHSLQRMATEAAARAEKEAAKGKSAPPPADDGNENVGGWNKTPLDLDEMDKAAALSAGASPVEAMENQIRRSITAHEVADDICFRWMLGLVYERWLRVNANDNSATDGAATERPTSA